MSASSKVPTEATDVAIPASDASSVDLPLTVSVDLTPLVLDRIEHG